MDPVALAREAKRLAAARGFDACGITSADPVEGGGRLTAWLAAGHHAGMAYMARDPAARAAPRALLPEARSVLVVGASCHAGLADPPSGSAALFARYARGADYHDVLRGRLAALHADLEVVVGHTIAARACVDAAPLLERALAVRAGLGFLGKSAMLINRAHGTWLLLAELLVDVEMAPDAPVSGSCGRCTRCIDACPTQAIVQPGVVDARLCLAYQTIEHKGTIAPALAAAMAERVFGCDVCQDVCPHNARAARLPPRRPLCALPGPWPRPSVVDLAALSGHAFHAAYAGTPVTRCKRRGLVRNAVAALSARTDPASEVAVARALADPEALVREQAALARSGGA